MIIERFNLSRSSAFILQYFDEEWQSYIDIDYVDCLVDKTKLRVASVDVKSAVSPERVDDQDVSSQVRPSDTPTTVHSRWHTTDKRHQECS